VIGRQQFVDTEMTTDVLSVMYEMVSVFLGLREALLVRVMFKEAWRT
jgi:hypothetical protein